MPREYDIRMSAPDPDLLADFRRAVREKIERDLRAEGEAAESLRARVLPGLRRVTEEARREGLVGRVWLFGSFAWGQPADESDVDVMVEACRDEVDLALRLQDETGRMVHIVNAAAAPEDLRRRAMDDGVEL
jgi:predicted nucleotidyltransferase